MRLNIGENIKRLRKERDITQEEFSEILGVTCQSVSRWENNLCYPDIELIPTIASFFGISTDRLIGVDAITEKSKVEEYLQEFQRAINRGDVNECIQIARAGVAEYPNNFALLNKLMYSLFLAGDSDGNIPEWKENMEKYDAEIVALGERIIKYCPNQSIRLEAASRLAFQHCEMGRKAIGRAVYGTLPPAELCRESQMWWGLEEEEKLPFLRDKIKQNYTALKNDIRRLAKLLPKKDSATVLQKAVALGKLIWDETPPENTWFCARIHCDMASTYARIGDADAMYAYLETAAKSAIAFDNRPEVEVRTSLVLGTVVENRIDFDTADTRPLREILRDKWLACEDFDAYRDTDTFKAILKILN